MPVDYNAIRADNKVRYGTDIGRIGKLLLSDRYADRTHFIFELLQNAEDALRRRKGKWDKRSVTFKLLKNELRVSHFGELFTEGDVLGICGIGESTKGLTAIGRFGIGFKAVYAFTDCPEIHSGQEHFAIDTYVWPRAIGPVPLEKDETIFVFPFREDDSKAFDDIAVGLEKLGEQTLLFLGEIEEISWSVQDGKSGTYIRSKRKSLAGGAHKIVLVGQDGGDEPTDETWLVFSRGVTIDRKDAGCVEIAFALKQPDDTKTESIQRLTDSKLVVFFPTNVTTNLGFLVQGPYRTTPSRDNVPKDDEWNQYLVQETATLLVDALRALRDSDFLDIGALMSLPLERERFGGGMFWPLFDAIRKALLEEPLLPCFGGGYTSGRKAELARSRELIDLLKPAQLQSLFCAQHEMKWLSENITQNRTPILRQYLMQELGIQEIDPEAFVRLIPGGFLEAQIDEWMKRFYEFLLGQRAIIWLALDKAIIRLENGSHVMPFVDKQVQAFLPGPEPTDFPTVRKAVCGSEDAMKFLSQIGLSEPDLVDDVIRNVVPKYTADEVEADGAEYEEDIRRILKAFATDSKAKKEQLVAALRDASFIMAVDAGEGKDYVSTPDNVYLATERLKALFEGVSGVMLVDDSYSCLHGEDVRELLEACGATRYLQPVAITTELTAEERYRVRAEAHCTACTSDNPLEDFELRGLKSLIGHISSLPAEMAAKRSVLLWDALCDVEDRRGTGAFSGTYSWFYYRYYSRKVDSSFVRMLNGRAWVPDEQGKLQPPGNIVFERLNPAWKENAFLQTKVKFKPPVIEALAREAGIEPGVLELLKKLGVTSVEGLAARLKDIPSGGMSIQEALEKLGLGKPTPPEGDDDEPANGGVGGAVGAGAGTGGGGTGIGRAGGGSPGGSGGSGGGSKAGGQKPGGGTGGGKPGASGGRSTFVSYVATHHDEKDGDPDGLRHEERMELENQAIKLIMSQEPELVRMPEYNPGFDLIEPDGSSQPIKWIEVKAMKGTLEDRPVGLSATQFQSAQKHGEKYWLYVVEQAGDNENARVVRIQDPAGKASYFTFDHGWKAAAEVDEESEHR